MSLEKVFPTTLMGKIYYSRLLVSIIHFSTAKEELAKKSFFITTKAKNYFLNGASEAKKVHFEDPPKFAKISL